MKTKQTYSPKKNQSQTAWRISKETAQLLGEAAERLYAEHGVVRPKDLVDEARSKRSPLHDLFTWDNEKAAEAHRLYEARKLLASYEVIIENDETQKDVIIRGAQYVDSQGGYVPTGVVLRNSNMLDEVVEAAKREAVSWHNRYQHLANIAKLRPIVKATAKLAAELSNTNRKKKAS